MLKLLTRLAPRGSHELHVKRYQDTESPLDYYVRFWVNFYSEENYFTWGPMSEQESYTLQVLIGKTYCDVYVDTDGTFLDGERVRREDREEDDE